MDPRYQYEALVTSVVDGDTVGLDVDLGLRTHKLDRFRLAGIDAWEVRGEEREKGLAARRALINKILAKVVMIQTHKDRQGKYGRWLVDIWLDGENVNEWLVEQGHAIRREY